MSQSDLLPGLRDGSDSKAGREALRAGRFAEAAEQFERALVADPPGAIDDLLGLAEARLWLGSHAEVERVCRAVIAREPGHRDARALLGIAMAHLDDPAEAVGYLLAADDHPAVHLGMATAMDRLGRFTEAEASARRALAMAPDDPGALRSLGLILANQRRHGESLSAFSRALKANPDDPATRLALAQVRLALGHDDAWPEIDWRLKVAGFASALTPIGPAWDGVGPVAGKTLLLLAEAGAGEQFQFVRFAAVLRSAGVRVILGCRPEMAEILAMAEGVDRVVTDPSSLDEPVDAHAYLMSLPGLLRVTGAELSRAAYLHVDPSRAARWAADVAALSGAYKVAIHWGGRPADRRAIPLDQLAPLGEHLGARLIALQKPPAAGDSPFPLAELGAGLHTGPSPFADIAALMTSVDLVITVDSVLAHLAGALGVPAWVALPVGPDWRWMADRDISPWYPNLRLYRQTRPGDWSDVVAEMTRNLRAGVACRLSPQTALIDRRASHLVTRPVRVRRLVARTAAPGHGSGGRQSPRPSGTGGGP